MRSPAGVNSNNTLMEASLPAALPWPRRGALLTRDKTTGGLLNLRRAEPRLYRTSRAGGPRPAIYPSQFIAVAQVFGELFQHDKREMQTSGLSGLMWQYVP
jgi:hypothetical protein